MGDRQQIQEISGALRATLEKAHAEYGAVVRKVRWGDGPIYVCGAGECSALGLAAGYALEFLLGLPVVARPVEVFQSYGLSLLRPRAVLIMISTMGEWPEALELAQNAQERGCTLVVLTNDPESAVAKLADHILLISPEGDAGTPAVTVCLHAAINLLALKAVRTLKRPSAHWDAMQGEFDQLPDKIDWAFTQLPSVIRSVAAEVAHLSRLRIVAGGFYHFPAWRVARRMRLLTGLQAEAMEASDYWSALSHSAWTENSVLFLSGSHSKLKKLLHRCAAKAHERSAHVFSLTDGNDRELVEGSDLGILIPSLAEPPSCILTMFMLEWLTMEIQRATKRPMPPR